MMAVSLSLSLCKYALLPVIVAMINLEKLN